VATDNEENSEQGPKKPNDFVNPQVKMDNNLKLSGHKTPRKTSEWLQQNLKQFQDQDRN
jgi:hypothetical protein